MFPTIFLFILGFLLLIKGADILIDGSSSIARKYGISTFVIGLTIVAFGTSMPELIVSTLASIRGSSGIALGNIIGSNITNTLLILGVAAIIYPLVVKKATIRKEIPFSLLAIAAVGILVNDFLIDGNSADGLTRVDGLILILFFSIFVFYTFGISKVKENIFEKIQGEIKEEPKVYSNFVAFGMIIVGLAGLAIGGKWLVDGAVEIASIFGMSEALIGLTIIAIGTSLPELAASVVAVHRKRADIAMGAIIGSNIFNFLWVLGLSSTINPINYNRMLNMDMLILFGITLMLLFLIYVGKKNVLGRLEGIVLVCSYVLYMVFLIIRG